MIDFLSNPCWIEPQIDFLLFLQNIRIEQPEIIDKFFLSITIFGEFWLPTLICAIIYWCFDFRAGMYLFSLMGVNVLLAHLLKSLACVYRPWVLSDKIHPSELAIPYAKGYSFPSGHSAMSSSILGGTALLIRKYKLLVIAIIGLILLIGFSRLWLGVHTPQDVVCGLLIGFVLIFLINQLIDWMEKDRNRYMYVLGIINLFAVFALIYVCFFNSYRVDYIDGQLLVDPKKSIHTTFTAYGYALGILNGSFLCRRFFPFNPINVSSKVRVLRGIAGIAVVLVLIQNIFNFIMLNSDSNLLAFVIPFVAGIIITLVYPMLFLALENKISKTVK